MHLSTQAEIAALLLTIAAHVVGAGVLIWDMLESGDGSRPSWRDWWPRDDRPEDPPLAPEPQPSGGGLPLPLPAEAVPSPVRLREPGRISDRKPRPARRPAHAPAPERAPAQPSRQ